MSKSISTRPLEMRGNDLSLGSFPGGYIPKGIYTPPAEMPPVVEMAEIEMEAVS